MQLNTLKSWHWLGAGMVCLAAGGSSLAQVVDPQADPGRRLVRKYCSDCHDVSPHPTAARRGADGAPGFAALAGDPVKGTTAHLKSVLGGPHSSMPPHQFSGAEVDGITGYFRSLSPEPKPLAAAGTGAPR
jgi:mono/diheme cytochrome c family protein